MSKSIWQLADTQARLETSAFSAQLDLRQPQRGLQEWTCRGAKFAAELFQIGLQSSHAEAFSEAYVRERDLVAVYEASEQRPVRVQIYWRALLGVEEATLPGVELVVSVQTGLLDSDPVLTIGSRLPAGEMLRLCDARNGKFEMLWQAGRGPVSFERPQPGCLLLRPEGADFSYVELVHPSDFRQAGLSCDAQGIIVVRQQLFADRLEKGVILRSRLRGHFVPRVGDTIAALRLFRSFANAEPLLTA